MNNSRRTIHHETNTTLTVGPLTVDLRSRHALINGAILPVPQCAFDSLVVLLRHAGEAVSYRQMVEGIRPERLGALEAQDMARLKVYMLRKIIEANPQKPKVIRAVDGFGYRLEIL